MSGVTRVRLVLATMVVGAFVAAGTVLAQGTQAPQLPPFKPILAGKTFTPPIKGSADVEFTRPVRKRDKDNVVTKVEVKNISNAPIARLTIDETFYDKTGATIAGGKGVINGLLQPGEIQTITIETPYNAKMSQTQDRFTHANGTVKPKQVDKLTAGDSKEPSAKPAAKAPARKK